MFEKIGKKKATLFRRDVLGEFSLKMDIQVYNVLPDKLKKEIDKNGKVIWKR